MNTPIALESFKALIEFAEQRLSRPLTYEAMSAACDRQLVPSGDVFDFTEETREYL